MKRKDFWIVLVLFLVHLYPFSLKAQSNTSIKFDHISGEKGLSQSYVVSIAQDANGFMWFGTQEGLNKYDGNSFNVYLNNPADTNSLGDNQILCTQIDHKGFIWIGTRGSGLNRFDPSTQTFTRYMHDPTRKNAISHNEITTIYEDHNHHLWIGTNGGGLNHFDPEDQIFTVIKADSVNHKRLSSNYIQAITEDQNHNIWIGTLQGGINVYNKDKDTFTHFVHDPKNTNSLSGNSIFALLEDHKGNIWIGTEEQGINVLNPSTNQIKRYTFSPENTCGLNNKRILSLLENRNHEIWIGTEGGGINIYHPEKECFTHLTFDVFEENSLSNNRVWSLYQDNAGNIWAGTWGGGINFFSASNKKFEIIRKDPNNPNSLLNNIVYPIHEDRKGYVWIGTQKGLVKYNMKEHTFYSFQHNSKDPASLSSNDVFAICEDYEGVLWIGTWDGGISRLDPDKEKFTHFKYKAGRNNCLSSNNIMCILEDSEGYLWIGTEGGGLNRLDKDRENFTIYKHDADNPFSVSHNDIFFLYEDMHHDLWVGTWAGGLNKYIRKENRFIHIAEEILGNQTISSIHEDKNGSGKILWLGTSSGLYKLNIENNNLSPILSQQDMLSTSVFGILEDNQSFLWLTTNHGMYRYNKNSGDLKFYDENDGLQSNEFNSWAYCELQSGRFLVGGINGINTFYPDSIKDNPYIPPVHITQLKIFNEDVTPGLWKEDRTLLNKTLEYTDEIHLSYRDKVITFEFVALNYTLPYRNQYAYILENFEKKWNFTGNRRFATYTNLAPGEYIFKVMGSNNDGVWNETGDNLKIYIHPPFWKTTWFISANVILSVILLILFIKFREKNIKKQNERLEYQVAERTKQLEESNATKEKFLSIISHDLTSPFNSLLGFLSILHDDIENYSLEEQRKMVGIAYGSATNINGLLNNLLSWSRNKSKKNKPVKTIFNINELVNNVFSILKLTAQNKNIRFISLLKKDTTVVADSNQISTVLRNILSNAIKFSKPGDQIIIDSMDRGSLIEISITDHGTGISKENLKKLFREDIHFTMQGTKFEKGTGLGLILCKEFVALNDGKIWAKSEEGKGTTMTFSLYKPNEKD